MSCSARLHPDPRARLALHARSLPSRGPRALAASRPLARTRPVGKTPPGAFAFSGRGPPRRRRTGTGSLCAPAHLHTTRPCDVPGSEAQDPRRCARVGESGTRVWMWERGRGAEPERTRLRGTRLPTASVVQVSGLVSPFQRKKSSAHFCPRLLYLMFK